MSAVTIRRFHRRDRAALTRIVNAHVAALLPGAQLSTQRILAQLEDEPDEIVTNSWVDARSCLVAERSGTVVSLALVVHYSDVPETSESLRGLTFLRWVVGDVDDPEALDAVIAAATKWALAHRSQEIFYEGAMPVPGCHGAPETWPHVADALDRSGFDAGFDSWTPGGRHQPSRANRSRSRAASESAGHDSPFSTTRESSPASRWKPLIPIEEPSRAAAESSTSGTSRCAPAPRSPCGTTS